MCNLKKYFLWLIYFRNEAQKFKNLSYKTRIRELQLFNNNKINQQPFTANCQKLEASCQLLKATCKPPKKTFPFPNSKPYLATLYDKCNFTRRFRSYV